MTDKIRTFCRACTFARFEGNTQVGCRAGRLDKFIEKLPPDEIRLMTQDDQEFYSIDRFCTFCSKEEVSLEKKREEVIPPVAFIIVGNDYLEITFTIYSALNQEIRPKELVIVMKDMEILKEVRYFLIARGKEVPTWKTVLMVDKTAGADKMMNEGVSQIKSPQFAVFESGYRIPADYISEIDRLINDELEQPIMIYNKDGDMSGLFCSKMLHNAVGGNREITAAEKVGQIVQESGCFDGVLSWEQIRGK